MKLSEHVDKLRQLIEKAFDKHFAQLGIREIEMVGIEKVPEAVRSKRQRLEAMIESHIGETGGYQSAREKLIDELTFTLFNRLAAIKVMEAAALFPPVLTKYPDHGNRSFGHKEWLEKNPHMRDEEQEGIRDYIKYEFDKLGELLPLYRRTYPYAQLPDIISLNEIIDAFNDVEKDPQVGSDLWQSDDVLGWMYESYNNEKKRIHKESGSKTEYDKVSLQSQFYTPRWVVQFLVENSLGKLYLEMYPGSEIKDRYKIANAPKTQERKPRPLHEIKLIDPACGSGNFLLYAFDFFFELYVDQIENYGADYDERDIAKLIVENNLHGIDLDDRAVQLAQLGLYIKAKKKKRQRFDQFAFRVVSSDFYLPEYNVVEQIFTDGNNLDDNQLELVQDIWSDLQEAYKFGSLIRLNEKFNARIGHFQEQVKNNDKEMLFAATTLREETEFKISFFANLRVAVEQYAQTRSNAFLASKTHDAITFLELLATNYDVATANPPYTDSADFKDTELEVFIKNNYQKPHKFHTNLYATFIKRCYELTGEKGLIAMISPRTFMYIKSFESCRKYIITNSNINLLVELEMGGVFEFSNVAIDVVMYVFEKGSADDAGIYFDLREYHNYTKKGGIFERIYDNFMSGVHDTHVYRLEQSQLKIIKSWPFIYWISGEFREKFGVADIQALLSPVQGAATTNNLKFLRFWWEIDASGISDNYRHDRKKWVIYSKGGPYEKWYGNLWLVLNYENQGIELRQDGAVLRNSDFYFEEGVTYSASGSKGASFRYLPENCIFDTGGSCIFANKQFKNHFYILGFMNSKLVSYIVDCLNPTVNAQVGDMQRVPFVLPSNMIETTITDLVVHNVGIKKSLGNNHLVERNSHQFPFVDKRKIHIYFDCENHLHTQILINESVINKMIFELYSLTESDKAMVLAKKGESIGGLPVSEEARTAYLAETEATEEFPLDNIRDFIESLPTRTFTTEERKTIEDGFPALYQSNNDLEEFCIRHQVNPINIWYWFKQSNVIPQQRMNTLAMEFLADIIREILMEDDDGIIPLVPNAGEKILLDRIEEKFYEKGFDTAQYSNFDSILGRPLHEYLNGCFFEALSNHLNLFMYLPKTPFIWHLSSGTEHGFDCYVIIYKWNRDKLLRIRSVYVEQRERALANRQKDIAGNNSAEAQNEKDRISRQLMEIESFKTKIDQLLAEGYDPVLDDGVGKNIAPLQNKKMIPYDVLNAGQLKKYLNADW